MTKAKLRTATKKQLIEYISNFTCLLQTYRQMPVEAVRGCAIRYFEQNNLAVEAKAVRG